MLVRGMAMDERLVQRTALPPLGFPSRLLGVERRDWVTREQLVRRVRDEFEEMPGLRLTLGQAKLLFGLEHGCCQRILHELAQSGYLIQMKNGLFGRRDLVA
jgi:hypothetical protein